MIPQLNLDPVPDEWITEDRLSRLRAVILPALSVLQESKALNIVLKTWLKNELAESSGNSDLSCWAHQQWGHRLESFYLVKKEQLDTVSCRMIRVKSKEFAFELYHRLSANEVPFEDLSARFGKGRERYHEGRFDARPLSELPTGLATILAKLTPGELTQPLKVGNLFALVELITYSPAVLDDSTKSTLCDWALSEWLEGMAQALESRLS